MELHLSMLRESMTVLMSTSRLGAVLVSLQFMFAGGCASMQLATGAHVPVSDAPSRHVSAEYAFGTWWAWKQGYVLDLRVGGGLGPLGKKSNFVTMVGGRFTTASHGWRPGFYGSLQIGAEAPSTSEGSSEPPPPKARATAASLGVAWTSIEITDRGLGPDAYASVLLGLVYHHQEQDNIGGGDFLGLELSAAIGANLMYVLDDATSKED